MPLRSGGNHTPAGRGGGLDGEHHPGALAAGRAAGAGLDTTRPILAVLDGAKALSAAVQEVFDHPGIGRWQLHKSAPWLRTRSGWLAVLHCYDPLVVLDGGELS